jgi:uncharacterized membrane protein
VTSAGTDPPGGTAPARYLPAQLRLALAGVLGGAAWAAVAFVLPWEAAVLVGWDVMAAAYLAASLWTIGRSDSAATARRAQIEDPSRAGADLVLVSACSASLVGVAFAFAQASQHSGADRALISAIAVLAVVLSWLSVHAVYTLRYADLYYTSSGGVDFPHGEPPDYRDFAYLAFTIGMTYQVSDTALLSKPIRRTALRHALISYVFGVAVIATTINVLADFIRR